MSQHESLIAIAKEIGLLLETDDYADNKRLLAARINELIQNDFNRLIGLLYRFDVSEEKLKLLLKEQPGTDAGVLIADLIIERQAQKIESRRKFNQPNNDIDEADKW